MKSTNVFSTSEFVAKLNEDKKKQAKNKRRGKGHANDRLPNDTH